MSQRWLELENDVCVITGAVGGMGVEICREFAKQKSGRMVHVSTVASHTPETYSSTKARVSMLSKQFAAEWGQFGVRSNAVCPCFVKTPLSRKFYEDKEVEKGRTRMIASRRIGETIDIANAVLYLASKRSDYSNGTELVVDGGYEVMLGDLAPRPGGRRQFAIEQHATSQAVKK